MLKQKNVPHMTMLMNEDLHIYPQLLSPRQEGLGGWDDGAL